MADTKITELTDLAVPADADLLVVVDDVAGTATTKKATWENLKDTITHTEILDIGTNTHAQIDTAVTASTNHIADTTLHFTSNALWSAINSNTASCALIQPHISDASDPHGATLTQTHLLLASGAITADVTASGAVYIPNVFFATSSGGITASNYTTGTLMLIYT